MQRPHGVLEYKKLQGSYSQILKEDRFLRFKNKLCFEINALLSNNESTKAPVIAMHKENIFKAFLAK